MQAGAESGPRLRANRSPSIIVNQCICKCLPLRWQTHSFAKLTTFLNSSYLSLQMISPYPRFFLLNLSFFVSKDNPPLPYQIPSPLKQRTSSIPPLPSIRRTSDALPTLFWSRGQPKLWGIFPVAAPRQISRFLSDFLEVSFAEMVACPALKTCTLLISRAGQFAQKLGSVMSGQPAGGAGSALLTRVMMDDTRLMTILYPGQRSL